MELPSELALKHMCWQTGGLSRSEESWEELLVLNIWWAIPKVCTIAGQQKSKLNKQSGVNECSPFAVCLIHAMALNKTTDLVYADASFSRANASAVMTHTWKSPQLIESKNESSRPKPTFRGATLTQRSADNLDASSQQEADQSIAACCPEVFLWLFYASTSPFRPIAARWRAFVQYMPCWLHPDITHKWTESIWLGVCDRQHMGTSTTPGSTFAQGRVYHVNCVRRDDTIAEMQWFYQPQDLPAHLFYPYDDVQVHRSSSVRQTTELATSKVIRLKTKPTHSSVTHCLQVTAEIQLILCALQNNF